MKSCVAIIIHSHSRDVFRILKQACAEAKKRLRTDKFLTPIWHYESPFGHIVLVEVPKELGLKQEKPEKLLEGR